MGDKIVGVRRNDINMEMIEGKQYLIVNLKTLKRRGAMKGVRRNIPIPIKKGDREPLQYVIDYIKDLPYDLPVFEFNRKYAWSLVHKYTGLFPHFFRHMRNTELVIKYNFTGEHLKKWNGWKDSRPSDIYVHLNVEDLASQFSKKD